MPPDDRDRLNRIEELQKKLFSKNYQTKIEHRGNFSAPSQNEVPDSWENSGPQLKKEFFKKSSVFKKFFLFSLGFFALSALYASYIFFFQGNTVSGSNIEITVSGNNFTAGGEELPLEVEVVNKNNSPLEGVDLFLEYPKSSSSDAYEETERLRETLGTIPAGGVKRENFKVRLFGEQGSIRPIKISIEYRIDGSNGIFTKEKMYDVTVSSTPINLTIDAPTKISPNQEITFDVTASHNGTEIAPDILLRIDYPLGFQFESAKPEPTFGNNVWELGDLQPGAEKKISLVGKMLDVADGEEKTFRVSTGSQSAVDKSKIQIVFNSINQTLGISKPFIEGKLFINGEYKREHTVDAKSSIRGEIRFANNLDTKINDLEISAKVVGNAVDRKSISVQQGIYNSIQNTIIWDQNSYSKLSEIDPGEEGSVTFSLASLPSYSTSGLLSDPTISIDVSISGKQPLEGNTVENVNSSDSKIIKISSDVGLAAKAVYFASQQKNTGPIPPIAEQKTTYTVVWTVSNTVNNISRAQVVARLPSFVRFVGNALPASENLSYNSSTKEVTWNVGSVPRGTGITTAGKEVSFQIEFTPSLSQVGDVPTILNDSILTGHDDFANVDIRVNKASLNTRLSNDPAFPAGGERVGE